MQRRLSLTPAVILLLASALTACVGPNRYTQPGVVESGRVVIKGHSRNYLFGADDMSFDLVSESDNTLVADLNQATVAPGRYCVRARRWTMAFRTSDMVVSDAACFDAEAGHTYLVRRRGDAFRVIDRRDPEVVSVAAESSN
jgi:hypothetical protein